MSYDWMDAQEDEHYERLYHELGPLWVKDHGYELYQEHYAEAVKEFTADRLRSYYVAHARLADPAHNSLLYAQALMPAYPRAALVFAATAVELAIKSVLLTPIVFGLVHTEGLASFIAELATQHTGMERFYRLLTEILSQFGGVDLRTFSRATSGKTLWQEIADVQAARNAVIHKGHPAEDATAQLAVAVAETLLKRIFPQVLTKLDLHLHEPVTVCAQLHPQTT
jgi:hypothetical protein